MQTRIKSFFVCTILVEILFLPHLGNAQGGWTEIPLPITDPSLSVISFADSSRGCLCGQNNVFLYTSDNGMSWSTDLIPSAVPISNCKLVSDSVAWAFGFGFSTQGVIFRSTDRGDNWLQVDIPETLVVLGVAFGSESNAWLATTTHIWVTTDGGNSWEQRGQLLGSYSSFPYNHPIEFFDDSIGFISGSGGSIITDLLPQKTTDGGWTWNVEWTGSFHGGGGVWNSGPVRFLKGGVCTFTYGWQDEIGVSDYGLVLSWNRLQDTLLVRIPQSGAKGFALDHQNIWLLRSGYVTRTTNGGATWLIDTLAVPISEILYDLGGHKYALGNGRLFRLDIQDNVEPERALPDHYALEQNYPNPFNPSTRIDYQIPERELVTLKIYDILGREVAVPVNDIEDLGFKSIEWNATNFASGVYFYQLKAGQYVKTKKLMLIR
ncbi:MAG: YCF48-related protein [Bacteroidota bacterium]